MWILFDPDIIELQKKYLKNNYPIQNIINLFEYHCSQAIPVDRYAGQFESEVYIAPTWFFARAAPGLEDESLVSKGVEFKEDEKKYTIIRISDLNVQR